uniref:WD repeat containing, antisense to TP73 n=1 Tax=Vombatus ursinus TaxID=29139 RepID=A0A4X2ME80_VOMUR
MRPPQPLGAGAHPVPPRGCQLLSQLQPEEALLPLPSRVSRALRALVYWPAAALASVMNFSEVFKLSNQLSKFSPNGKFLASCVQYRLVVRDVSTLQIFQLYTCLDQIHHLEWSADSLFILCAMYKRGLVQVWSLEQPEWHCKIDEGSAGLVASCWSPDGRHILNTTEFHLRITVWSLCTKSVSYIKYPKACQQDEVASSPVSLQTLKPLTDRPNPKIGIGALAFSPDNCFLATRNDNIPNAVWIWDIQKLKLFVVLEHLSAVRSFQWDPQQARLAVCTGRSQVYLWSPAGCVSVQVPAEGDFQILSLCWHQSGDSMALLSKDQLCLCYLENEGVK